jgi:two-component system chemotaxis sensor kinase CheA
LLPVYDASLILGKKGIKQKNKSKNSIVVVEYLEKRIGIMVDNIVNYMTVVVKPLPNVLKKFSAVQGVVFDENYNIIPLIHIPDLMKRMNSLKDYEVKSFEVNNGTPEYFVLVADDSHTTRQIEKMILEAEGYNVTIACDGIDALEKLKKQRFDILITDIKMPRMDGIVLIENVRRRDATKNLPIIVISSVFEEEILSKVKEVGAQGYIVKSDFERGNLVAKVKELLDEQK